MSIDFLHLIIVCQTSIHKKKPWRRGRFEFGWEGGKAITKTPEDQGIQGYIYSSNDGNNVAQFRIDGFTYNQLKPYTNWDNVINEAKYLWSLYNNTAKPELITRIAVRYINHLNISINLPEYITNLPNVPEGIPQTISSFLIRVVIEDSDRAISANVTQALEKSAEPECATVILDIDVYKKQDFETNDEHIWDVFSKMRELKNLIFFKSITEKTAEKYE